MRYISLLTLVSISVPVATFGAKTPISFSSDKGFPQSAAKIVVPSITLRLPNALQRESPLKKPRFPEYLYDCGGGVHQVQAQGSSLRDNAVEKLAECMLSCKSLRIFVGSAGEVCVDLSDSASIADGFSLIAPMLGLAEDDEFFDDAGDPDAVKVFKKEVKFEAFYTMIFEGAHKGAVEIDMNGDRCLISIDGRYACYSFARGGESDLETAILSLISQKPNQPLEPMARSVTTRAGARVAPALAMAHH